MIFRALLAAFLTLTLLSGGAAVAASMPSGMSAAQQPPASGLPVLMAEKDILPFLERVISWRRAVDGLEPSPDLARETVLKAELRRHMQKALDDNFALVQAIAGTLPPSAGTGAAAVAAKLDAASKEDTLRRAITDSEARAAALVQALRGETAGHARARLDGRLKLEKQHLDLLRAIARTIGVASDSDDSLVTKIEQLKNTVAEANDAAKPPESAPAAPDSSILNLTTRAFGLMQSRTAVRALLADTKSLYNDNRDRVQTVRDAVKNLMAQGDAAADPRAYDALVADMKALSKITVALSQSNESLKTCINDLTAWSAAIGQRVRELLADIVFRLSMLALTVGGVYALSLLAKKATRRYVTDARRRAQLRLVRKTVFSVTVGFILFFGFFTDLGSLATFAGLLTAGIAFATRDMILSVIAYFQFFSTSDLRVGDDVTVAGVTGKISHVGALRFYLMETEKIDASFLPTGRIVGFANSVLFNPTPLFRQPPGTNFVWNQLEITLLPNVDHVAAYNKLREIVQKVYAEQLEAIRRNEAALFKASSFKVEVSEPQAYFKFAHTGIAIIIRYAVERDQAQAFHLRVTSAILSAAHEYPELKVLHVS